MTVLLIFIFLKGGGAARSLFQLKFYFTSRINRRKCSYLKTIIPTDGNEYCYEYSVVLIYHFFEREGGTARVFLLQVQLYIIRLLLIIVILRITSLKLIIQIRIRRFFK